MRVAVFCGWRNRVWHRDWAQDEHDLHRSRARRPVVVAAPGSPASAVTAPVPLSGIPSDPAASRPTFFRNAVVNGGRSALRALRSSASVLVMTDSARCDPFLLLIRRGPVKSPGASAVPVIPRLTAHSAGDTGLTRSPVLGRPRRQVVTVRQQRMWTTKRWIPQWPAPW